MPSALNTGVPLAGGVVNSPGTERQPENLLFSSTSTTGVSHNIYVTETPVLLKALGLGSETTVYLYMVVQLNSGEVLDLLSINGSAVALNKTNNVLLIDLPGVYRLQCFESVDVGSFVVTQQQTNMSYWSWGLSAFGNRTSVNGPIPPP